MWLKLKAFLINFWKNYKEKRIVTPIKIEYAHLKEVDDTLYEEKVKSEVKKKIYLQYFLVLSILIVFTINAIYVYLKDLIDLIF
ncbi:hypothetical protein QI045_12610 [Staphylococcus saprophyticus]|nr:hypothetical protein [Staphylococcus saprophyticus]